MEELRRWTVFSDHRLTIDIMESLEFHHGSTGQGHYLTASLKPISVLVREPDGSYAVDLEELLMERHEEPGAAGRTA